MFIRKSEFIKTIHNVRKESHLLGFKDGKDFVMGVVKIHNNNHKKEAYCVMMIDTVNKSRVPVTSDIEIETAISRMNILNSTCSRHTIYYTIEVI